MAPPCWLSSPFVNDRAPPRLNPTSVTNEVQKIWAKRKRRAYVTSRVSDRGGASRKKESGGQRLITFFFLCVLQKTPYLKSSIPTYFLFLCFMFLFKQSPPCLLSRDPFAPFSVQLPFLPSPWRTPHDAPSGIILSGRDGDQFAVPPGKGGGWRYISKEHI